MDALNKIQTELHAPKNQHNKFGNYSYRSCEDILEGLKPLLKKTGATLVVQDEIVSVADRIYVKAIATLTHDKESISASAYAREPLQKKGMDEAQVTGATSSYARKYALNGLFCIDDNKDADSRDNRTQTIDVVPVDLQKVTKATDFFIDQINLDEDETTVAPRIKAAYNRLTSDEQIAVNQNLKQHKFGNRQMNTILKGFLELEIAA